MPGSRKQTSGRRLKWGNVVGSAHRLDNGERRPPPGQRPGPTPCSSRLQLDGGGNTRRRENWAAVMLGEV